jgi:biotin carboxylase
MSETTAARPPRLLLLMGPATYRAGAFLEAVAELGLEAVRGLDVPRELAAAWARPDSLALDFRDLPGATAAIVAAAAARPFDAILSVDDSATLLAAAASAALGLPHNDPESALAARDKLVMRARLAAGGAPVPGFRAFPLVSDPAEVAAHVSFPCVVKPLRLSGSRGVIRADDPAELAAAIARLRRMLLNDGHALAESEFLVESFIPGVEVALEGLLTDGDLHVLALFDKPDPLDGPFFEETIYVTPSRLTPEMQRAIAAATRGAAAALGLRHGPVHAELRVNERGPWLVEIAGRSIGGLCSTILQFGAGMTLEEIILRHAVGLPLATLERERTAAGVMMIPIPRAGLLRGVAGVEAARAVPGVTGIEITAPLNQTLLPLPEGAAYLGFIFAREADPATVEAALRAAHACLRFDIRPELPVLSVAAAAPAG